MGLVGLSRKEQSALQCSINTDTKPTQISHYSASNIMLTGITVELLNEASQAPNPVNDKGRWFSDSDRWCLCEVSTGSIQIFIYKHADTHPTPTHLTKYTHPTPTHTLSKRATKFLCCIEEV